MRMSNSGPVILTENLTKKYKHLVAVNNLSLKVESKQVHGFLGPNGAGKTTTIKMLVGLLTPDSGSLKVLGEDARGDKPTVREHIGYMPELPKFPKHLTGNELLDIYGRMANVPKGMRKERIPELVKMVGLEGRGKDRIGTYSKGMQQRIGIAQSLINDPELLILDEPSIGLDPVGMVEVRDMVKSIVQTGKTIFFSSHLLAEVQQICDHVTVINKGVALFSGTLDQITARASPSRRLVIEVEKPNDQINNALKALSYATVTQNGNLYSIQMNTKNDVRGEISRTITGSGGIILSMQMEGGGLEEAFLALVSDKTNN